MSTLLALGQDVTPGEIVVELTSRGYLRRIVPPLTPIPLPVTPIPLPTEPITPIPITIPPFIEEEIRPDRTGLLVALGVMGYLFFAGEAEA